MNLSIDIPYDVCWLVQRYKYWLCLTRKVLKLLNTSPEEHNNSQSQLSNVHISPHIAIDNTKMVFEGSPERSVQKKLSYSLPSPGDFDLERGPEPGNPSRTFTRESDDVSGSGASDKTLHPDPGSPGHGSGRGRKLSAVLHRTFTQQFRAADSGEKQAGIKSLFGRGKQAGKHWRSR